jgi:hypothetical protein
LKVYIWKKFELCIFFFEVSGLRNTAYSQFFIQQAPQIDTTRTAYLNANVSFDYDAPG